MWVPTHQDGFQNHDTVNSVRQYEDWILIIQNNHAWSFQENNAHLGANQSMCIIEAIIPGNKTCYFFSWYDEQVVGVQVNAGAKLTFGGTDENSGMLHLYSVGKLGPEKNNEYAKAFSEHLQKHFKIPSGR